MSALDPQSLLAAGQCYACFGNSPALLDLMELGLLNLIAQSLGTVASNAIVFGNYGGAAPTFTPASGNGVAIDSVTGQLWEYYGGAWH